MSRLSPITEFSEEALRPLCQRLQAESSTLEQSDTWPKDQITALAESGVFAWFIPQQFGGYDWKESDILRGYLQLSAACLTTAFVLTQLTGAIKRLVFCENDALRQQWLPQLACGDRLATVGISHLTTSHRHLKKPALRADRGEGGYLLNGFSPWVTAAAQTNFVMTGAALEDGRQLLAWVPVDAVGVRCGDPQRLVALSASSTGQVYFENVFVHDDWLLSEPAANIMQSGGGASTGGLQTSTLALGLAASASRYIAEESTRRPELENAARQLRGDIGAAESDLMLLAGESHRGDSTCTAAELRATANSLVLRATQAALVAAKGAGFVQGHPVGRWCREALFFLVWSCPQPVSAANLCEFARIE